MDKSILGHLVLLSVEVEDDTGEGRDDKCIDIYIWTPNEILEKDEGKPFIEYGGSYFDCMNDHLWDDWSGPFQHFIGKDWCETGDYEPVEIWKNVRLDDERIQLAFIDPLNENYDARYLKIKYK